MTRFFVPALIPMLTLLVGCAEGGLPTTLESSTRLTAAAVVLTPTPEIVYVAGPSTPPDGQIILSIGQDVGSIDAYTAVTGAHPSGVTGYTSLTALEGITQPVSYGSGPHHLDRLAKIYPHSAINLGLYVVNYLINIHQGAADGNINRLLVHLARYDRPIFLRFGYEFDGPWNFHNPDDYVAAWIYFHELLQKRGLDNVIMVWQGATHCEGTYENYPISAWYPGDEYVDWVGLSYFIQEAECDNAPLEEMAAFAREHQKPLLIVEATPQRYYLQNLTYSKDGRAYEERTPEEIWDSWYAPFFAFISNNADVVRGMAYINARWDDQFMWGPPYTSGYWGDSRVQANRLILEKWQAELAKDTWLQTGPDLFSLLNSEQNP